jgi:hypothetical protein
MTSLILCIGFIRSCKKCHVLGILSSKYLYNWSFTIQKSSISMHIYFFYVIYICIVLYILDTHVIFLLLIIKRVSFNIYVQHEIKSYLAWNQGLLCSSHMLHCTPKRTSCQRICSEACIVKAWMFKKEG